MVALGQCGEQNVMSTCARDSAQLLGRLALIGG
jgi:hypothetical protein